MTLPLRSPSPAFSNSSVDPLALDDSDQSDILPASASRPGSPSASTEFGGDAGSVAGAGGAGAGEGAEQESVACQWDDCGRMFTQLPALIDHIHNDHIGVHKSNYTCEWVTCARKGIAQTSRFALISHIRSHTGEKPFTCTRPECDKSFTRSDALAKHMRLQHNIMPTTTGRGGNRKRKRPASDDPNGSAAPAGGEPSSSAAAAAGAAGGAGGAAASAGGSTAGGFSTFKVEPQTPGAEGDDLHSGDYFGRPGSPSGVDRSGSRSPGALGDGSGPPSPVEFDAATALPASLLAKMSPRTGLIDGRTPAQVAYVITKAKYRFALEQHADLLEQLRTVRREAGRMRGEKEQALSAVLESTFGPQAESMLTGGEPDPVYALDGRGGYSHSHPHSHSHLSSSSRHHRQPQHHHYQEQPSRRHAPGNPYPHHADRPAHQYYSYPDERGYPHVAAASYSSQIR